MIQCFGCRWSPSAGDAAKAPGVNGQRRDEQHHRYGNDGGGADTGGEAPRTYEETFVFGALRDIDYAEELRKYVGYSLIINP